MDEVKEPEVLDTREEYQQEVETGINIIRQKVDLEKAKKKLKTKKKLYSIFRLLGLIGTLLLICGIYIVLPVSNVRSVKIVNNNYLSDEYIQELTGVSTKSEYVLLFTALRSFRAAQSPLVNNIKIERGPNKTVIIDVDENPIMGYRYGKGMELILGDGSIIAFDQKYIKGLTILPMFMNVEEEKISRVAQAMNKLDFDTISRIAEVRDFSLSYDSDMVKFIMDDGYTVYSSVDGIPLLKSYISIITTTTSANKCIYLDYDHNNAIVRNCQEMEKMAGNAGSQQQENTENTEEENGQ